MRLDGGLWQELRTNETSRRTGTRPGDMSEQLLKRKNGQIWLSSELDLQMQRPELQFGRRLKFSPRNSLQLQN